MSIWAVGCAILIVCASTGLARGQGLAASPSAIVLVQPIGSDASVSVTFNGVRPHSVVRASVLALFSSGGWTRGAVSIKDEHAESLSSDTKNSRLQKITSCSFMLSGAGLYAGEAFRLQPFAEAFRGEGRIDVLYLVPRNTLFRGLRWFEREGMKVSLVQDNGPYRYAMTLPKGMSAVPKLPLEEPVSPIVSAPAAVAIERKDEGGALGSILLGSALAGLLSLGAMLSRIWLRSSRPVSSAGAGRGRITATRLAGTKGTRRRD